VKRILVVEDDRQIAASLEIRLEAAGYNVLVAGDAVQGASMGVKLRPDLIVLDVSLPAGNGLVLAEHFKKMPETAGRPIIAITASKAAGLRKKAMSLDLAGFFEKPYDIEELLGVIHAAFDRHDFMSRQSQPFQATVTSATTPTALQSKRILIVEDDAKLAMALALRIKAAGYETILAFDALLGLSNAVKLCPDLVLLDISMPAGNGLDLAQKIQKTLTQPPPIIFLTASKQEGLREKALQVGAVGFFEKPYEAEDLMAAVHSALESASSAFAN
jgi:DNA-binding response OmpR family regulator